MIVPRNLSFLLHEDASWRPKLAIFANFATISDKTGHIRSTSHQFADLRQRESCETRSRRKVTEVRPLPTKRCPDSAASFNLCHHLHPKPTKNNTTCYDPPPARRGMIPHTLTAFRDATALEYNMACGPKSFWGFRSRAISRNGEFRDTSAHPNTKCADTTLSAIAEQWASLWCNNEAPAHSGAQTNDARRQN